ncbi:hypothetical protein ACFSYD_13500 [Paracoccus aerius]|nr:hypothetical protein [Paracoccus aerius]
MLLTIKQAATRLGVPEYSLRKVADDHGMTIRIGRAVRLHPDDLSEIISLCRGERKDRASTGASGQMDRQSGKSGTATPDYRPAQTAAAMLKRSSRATLNANIAQVVPLGRKT